MCLSATKGGLQLTRAATCLNYEGVGLRRRRRTQDVAQTNALLKQLNTTTRSGTGFCLDKRMDPLRSRRRRGSSQGLGCVRSSATNGCQQPTGGPAGARILCASSDSIHSYTLLLALIATQIHGPTPAKSSHSCEGIQLGGRLNADTRLLVSLHKHIAQLA